MRTPDPRLKANGFFFLETTWEWATMVELEPVAHLRSQLAAFHMPLPCVKQKSVAERVVVLRQHRSDFKGGIPVLRHRHTLPILLVLL
jgi:hypothetical protein